MSYYTWKEDLYACSGCAWKGTGAQCTQGALFPEFFEIRCPSCSNKLGVIAFPTFEESRQNWDKLTEDEKKLVEYGEARQREIISRRLGSPDQLPDLEGDKLIFTWDIEDQQTGGDTLLRFGDEIVWREPASYEGYERFEMVAWILKQRYGKRLHDLVPTEESCLFLWGDRLSAPDIIERIRNSLKDQSGVTQSRKPELAVQTGHSAGVTSVAFSIDGKTLASGSGDQTIKLWDMASGRELCTLKEHSPEKQSFFNNWFRQVRSVAFSADGQTLASGREDKTIMLWEVASGRELRTLLGHSDSVNCVAFGGDGKTLASGSRDHTIKLWEVASGRELRTLEGHSAEITSVAFSPDSKTLASGSEDQTIKLWDLATVSTLSGHSNFVYSVAFSPDGKILASGSWDRTIKLWDVASGRELCTLKGHCSRVRSVAFSPDGKMLASGSGDQTIKLWDVATGRELHTLSGHSDFVTSVVFSVDGKTLASGSRDHTIKLWEVGSGRELRTF